MSDAQNGGAETPRHDRRASTTLALAVVLGVLVAAFGGYKLGAANATSRAEAQAAETAKLAEEERQIDALTNGLSDLTVEERMAERNVIWRACNGADMSTLRSPEGMLGRGLYMALSPKMPQGRDAGLRTILFKFSFYFDEEQSESLGRAIDSGTNVEAALAWLLIAKRDIEAGRLLDEVLSDSGRIKLLLEGGAIPLETLPDGSTP